MIICCLTSISTLIVQGDVGTQILYLIVSLIDLLLDLSHILLLLLLLLLLILTLVVLLDLVLLVDELLLLHLLYLALQSFLHLKA